MVRPNYKRCKTRWSSAGNAWGAKDALVPAGDAGSGSLSSQLFLTEKGSRIAEGTLRRRPCGRVGEGRSKKADAKPHDLGRAFGTRYLREDPGQPVEPAELTGHSDLSRVGKYAPSDAERARAGVARPWTPLCGK
jgi:integrase